MTVSTACNAFVAGQIVMEDVAIGVLKLPGPVHVHVPGPVGAPIHILEHVPSHRRAR